MSGVDFIHLNSEGHKAMANDLLNDINFVRAVSDSYKRENDKLRARISVINSVLSKNVFSRIIWAIKNKGVQND